MLNKNKNLSIFLSITLGAMVFAGCSKEPEAFKTNKAYTSQKAYDNGDVVEIKGNVYNEEKIKKFYNDFQNNKEGSIRLTKYDKKGNPTITDVKIDTDLTPHGIIYKVDHSLTSKTGSFGEEKEEYQCDAIKLIKESPATYGLEGCGYGEGEDDIVTLFKSKNNN